MRLAHLRDPAQHAYRQRSVKIVPNVFDHARETTRRDPKYLLARNVGSSNKGARQFPSEMSVMADAPMTRRFMPSSSTPRRAEFASWHKAARTPGCLFAITEAPTAREQISTPRSMRFL